MCCRKTPGCHGSREFCVWQLKDLFQEKRENPLHGYPLNPLCRWVQLTMPTANF
ncbi:hypothetical protein [Sporomusa ovata]|uniref:Acetyl-CoA synthase corrinoid activation protein n=1 Tax=Sporomusa ovata TaxID=2378 RepID=A0A0U1L4J1_9FIRM|nr:hypothetical protein [Sporomusa ovata]CQR74425.1 Acetyl-CoA synthase corrinoid activation protein [Sporomusa ovata]